MAVNGALLCQHAMIEFLVKENSSAANIFDKLCHVYGDSCMGASSVQLCVKHFKDGNKSITNLPHSCQQRTTTMECNK
jgi:hypothetical protein